MRSGCSAARLTISRLSLVPNFARPVKNRSADRFLRRAFEFDADFAFCR